MTDVKRALADAEKAANPYMTSEKVSDIAADVNANRGFVEIDVVVVIGR